MPINIFSFIRIATIMRLSIVKISTSFWIFRSEFSHHSTVNCRKIFWIKMSQFEIGVSSQSAVFAVDICINQFGNKLRCECNDESLKLKFSDYLLNSKFKYIMYNVYWTSWRIRQETKPPIYLNWIFSNSPVWSKDLFT